MFLLDPVYRLYVLKAVLTKPVSVSGLSGCCSVGFAAARIFFASQASFIFLSFLILEGFFCFPSHWTWGLDTEEKVEPWGLYTEEKVEPWGLATDEKVEPWGLVTDERVNPGV